MRNNYDSFELNSKALYKEITKISFSPKKMVNIIKKYNKGDKIWWKWLGFIPIFHYKAYNDLYECAYWGYGLKTIEELCEYFSHSIIEEDKIFIQAMVEVKTTKGYLDKYFDTNEEAVNYIDTLKKHCKEVGNDLF